MGLSYTFPALARQQMASRTYLVRSGVQKIHSAARRKDRAPESLDMLQRGSAWDPRKGFEGNGSSRAPILLLDLPVASHCARLLARLAGELNILFAVNGRQKTLTKSNPNDELAEQLLDSKKSERPKEHVLKTPKKPHAEEKSKAAKQRKAIQDDLRK